MREDPQPQLRPQPVRTAVVLQNKLVACCFKLKADRVHEGRVDGPVVKDELAVNIETVKTSVLST